MLAHYAEAGVLINSRGDILYIHGRTGKYLEPSSGDAALNIVSMAREGLRRELTTALHRAVAQKKPVEYRSLRVRSNGGFVSVDVTIKPVETPHGNADLFIVLLEEQVTDEAAANVVALESPDANSRVAELENELKAKEDYLQTTLEEMETTNEELKSTNEEMQSVNEELQSTNEELETSKEELQSVNEELSTVNAELQDKVAELSRANNDMNNLLAGTGVGTVFVDESLRILRFTPAATQVINLIPGDIGRPVEHLVPNLVGYETLMEDLRSVLDSLVPKEAEVQSKSGAWFLMRIRPYRTLENAIEGVVLTFIEITERKRAVEQLRQSEERFHAMFNQAFAGVAQTSLDGRFAFVNDRFTEMLGYSRTELLKMSMLDITHPDDKNRFRVLLDSLASGGSDFSIERRYLRRDQSAVWVTDRISGIREGDNVTSAVSVSFDLSQRKRLESEVAAVDASLTAELEAMSRLEGVRSLQMTMANQQAVLDELLGTAIAINQADLGTLQVCDPRMQRLSIVAQRGFTQTFVDFWDQASAALGSCADGTLAVEHATVADLTRSAPFAGGSALDMLHQAGVRAFQSAPLVRQSGEVIGILTTHFRVPHRPDARKSRLFELVAREVAAIVERGMFAAGPSHRARDA